jgi:hypothetical protein
VSALSPSVRAECQRILDQAARRLLAEKKERERRALNPTAAEWLEDTFAWMQVEYMRRADEEAA